MALNKTGNPVLSFIKRKWWVLLIVLIVLLLVAAGYFAFKYYSERNNKSAVQGAQTGLNTEDSPKTVLDEIKRVIVLPDENPDIATINNADLLKSQDFFKNAEPGDVVLIFNKAGRGLLYRPSTHKIIEYTKIILHGSLPH